MWRDPSRYLFNLAVGRLTALSLTILDRPEWQDKREESVHSIMEALSRNLLWEG
jgi:hypothetical protein